ncbi:uncharacterized protein MYCFIDRAFT_83784 [Pseudocercospora fijiensis CIRAD86]|uniref:Uncharacterized protein n=1 Tax=Pseudocercospora fijiensis (strain CIRAD86) TaxID=383855 RepID=M3AP31_PSEFD|nr:uncharacterized protein MYCFIDRAFT_83784 [Pseudocercospora fijiensis CIRAD86]EME78873.1 hypothetical protein MYCFIDRAFT_83784 [Pseudocercospora fijiensis CIRAD86]
MIAVRVPYHETVYVPEYVLHKESSVFQELIDRTNGTLLLKRHACRASLLIWLASATNVVAPELLIKDNMMTGVLCVEFAFHYRLFEFHNRVMRHIGMAIGAREAAWFTELFFRPEFEKAPIRQRLLDVVAEAADDEHPFGPLDEYGLEELDGTGFLVMFHRTVKELKTLGHLPPRVLDQWKPEDLE